MHNIAPAFTRDEVIGLLRRLITTPSVNGEHSEYAVAQVVRDFALSKGLASEILALDLERPNVLVRTESLGEPVLLLVAHMDTVPTGPEDEWLYPPFEAKLERGRIYGRGAADNKGGLAAGLLALATLQRLVQTRRPGPVLLACVPDEESGASGTLGVRYLLEGDHLRSCPAIYTYPGMSKVYIGHRGVLRYRLRIRGRAAHSGSIAWQKKEKGANAVTAICEILLSIEDLKRDREQNDKLFARFETVITPGTLIAGGTAVNIVPDTAEALIDIRLTPSANVEKTGQEIHSVADEVCSRRGVSFELVKHTFIPPTCISPRHRLVKAIQTSAESVLGRRPRVAVAGPANEAYILNEAGFPTCFFGPRGGNVHAPNEYVVVEAVEKAAAIYVRTALSLSGDDSQ